jgi:hypothetical protein
MRKIKFDRMAPTMQKSIDETIPEEHSTIALGATTFEVLSATSIWSAEHVLDEKLSVNYFELKYDDGLHYI